jgi:hypothetical protein
MVPPTGSGHSFRTQAVLSWYPDRFRSQFQDKLFFHDTRQVQVTVPDKLFRSQFQDKLFFHDTWQVQVTAKSVQSITSTAADLMHQSPQPTSYTSLV